MLKPLLISLALLMGSAQAKECPPTAQAPTPEQLAQGQREAKDRGALWKLEKDGRTSYLFGTLHLGRLAWAFPGPKLQAAIKATEVLAVELDVTDPGFMPALQQSQQKAAPLALTAGEQARLDAQADAACLPRAALASLHPVMQVTTYVSLAGRNDGLDPSYGQEMVLLGAARAMQRPVVALESVEQQMAVLMPSDPLKARRLLRQYLEGLENGEGRNSLVRMAKAWESGDLATISSPAKLCACTPTAEEIEFVRLLNDERNPHIAKRIAEEHAKGKPVLAAVGLLHMTGPKALQGLLAAQGFRVERVSY
jgi:uncharacterized protein YbaP (TraB family)